MIGSASITRSFQTWLAALCIAVPFLGMAPTNVALGGAASWFLYRIVAGNPRFHPSSKIWLSCLAVYLVVHSLVAVLSPEPLVSLRYVAKDWRLLGLLATASGLFSILSPHTMRVALLCMATCTVYGLATLLDMDLAVIGLAERYNATRTGSFLTNPNILAGVAMSAVFVPFLLPLKRVERISWWVLCAALLLMTGTRAAWLGTVAGILILSIFSPGRTRRYGLLTLLLASAFVLALPGTQQRIQQIPAEINKPRIKLWQAAWDMGHSRFWGVGPGRFESAHPPIAGYSDLTFLHAHNVPLHLFAEGGILLPAAWILMIGCWIFVLLRRRNIQAAAAGLGLLTAFLTADLFSHMFYRGVTAVPFFLLLGHALWQCGAGITPPPGHLHTNPPRRFAETEMKT